MMRNSSDFDAEVLEFGGAPGFSPDFRFRDTRRRMPRGNPPRKVPAPKPGDSATSPLTSAILASIVKYLALDAPTVTSIMLNVTRDTASARFILNLLCDLALKPLDTITSQLVQKTTALPLRHQVQPGSQPPTSLVVRCLGTIYTMLERSYWAKIVMCRGPTPPVMASVEDLGTEVSDVEATVLAQSPLLEKVIRIAYDATSGDVQQNVARILSQLTKTIGYLESEEPPAGLGQAEKLSDGVRHPRHHHDIAWRDVVRTNPNYARGGFVCNGCGVNSKWLCYHCPQCTFDLCMNCFEDASTSAQQKLKTQRYMLLLLEKTDLMKQCIELLLSPTCLDILARSLTQILLVGIQAFSVKEVEDAAVFTGHCIDAVEAAMTNVSSKVCSGIQQAIRCEREARPSESTRMSGEVSAAKAAASKRLAALDIDPSLLTGQAASLFLIHAESRRPQSPELRRLWNAIGVYLEQINNIVSPLGERGGIALPAAVLPLISGFAQYHLHQTLGGEESTMSLERTETERLMSEEGKIVSEVSNRANAAVSGQDTGEKVVPPPPAVIKFVEANRVAINMLIHWDPRLLERGGALHFMSRTPRLVDFEFKVKEFRRRLPKERIRGSQVNLTVSRAERFRETFMHFQGKSARELMGPLHVKFKDEEGADAGGLTREWLQLLAEDIVNPDFCLFIHSSEGMTFQPNHLSDVNPQHLEYFRFVGRIVALSVYHEIPLDVHFTRSVYRHLVGEEPCFRDVASIDPELFNNMEKLLKIDLDEIDLGLDFTISQEKFGQVEDIEMIPDGANVRVTNANKKEYIRLRCQMRMTKSIERQFFEFLSGFYEIIPRHLVEVFTEQELELVICGLPDIDVEDLRVNTDYQGYNASSPQIRWFWEVVAGMSKQDKANLLQFATGASKIPPGGFSNLEGLSGKTRFSIVKADMKLDHLPLAHTCFNRIDLPEYPSADVLREKLMIAINYGNKGFAML